MIYMIYMIYVIYVAQPSRLFKDKVKHIGAKKKEINDLTCFYISCVPAQLFITDRHKEWNQKYGEIKNLIADFEPICLKSKSRLYFSPPSKEAEVVKVHDIHSAGRILV